MVKVEKDAIEEENGDEEQQEEKDVTASSEIREFTVLYLSNRPRYLSVYWRYTQRRIGWEKTRNVCKSGE